MTLGNLYCMNSDWDTSTIFSVHKFNDFNNNAVIYEGSWRKMPNNIMALNVRCFGTHEGKVYIELEPGEEKRPQL